MIHDPKPTSVKEARLFVELDDLLPADEYGTLAQFAKTNPREFFIDRRSKAPRREVGKIVTQLCVLRGLKSMYSWPT